MSVSETLDRDEAPAAGDEPARVPAAGAPVAPRPIELARGACARELVDAVLRQVHDEVLRSVRAARALDDPEGVHQLRVAVRRARSALSLFRRLVAKAPARELRRELRWLGRALAPARDWDVFCVETLAEVRSAVPQGAGLRRLYWEAELRRLVAHRHAGVALDSERFAALVGRLDRFVHADGWRDPHDARREARLEREAAHEAAKLLDRLFGEVRILDRPVPQLSAAHLHVLRIRVKRLRYAVEFLAPLHPERGSRRLAKRLRVLQDLLGRINDGRVADALVDELLASVEPTTRYELARAAGLVSGWSHRRAVAERAPLEHAWRRVARLTPYWR